MLPKNSFKSIFKNNSILQYVQFKDLLKWLFISASIGILTGSGSAVFLKALELATNYREDNVSIIWFLPLGGLLIGAKLDDEIKLNLSQRQQLFYILEIQ